MAPDVLGVCPGVDVMCVRNLSEDVQNGTRGQVVGFQALTQTPADLEEYYKEHGVLNYKEHAASCLRALFGVNAHGVAVDSKGRVVYGEDGKPVQRGMFVPKVRFRVGGQWKAPVVMYPKVFEMVDDHNIVIASTQHSFNPAS